MARLRVATRLARLEPRLRPPPGCPACQGWTGVVLVGADGPHRPERCPGCGRAAPARTVVRVVGVRVAEV